MSERENLRGLISQRLAAATQEILGAVDRMVAGYEREALGFRLEVERQRRQLEALPRPLSDSGVKLSRSPGPAEEDEGEDERSSDQSQEDSTGQSPPRSAGHVKRTPDGPLASETRTHVDLRIRILQDSQTDVLSDRVLVKCPTQRLACPRGLQEGDFLDLLRSTFPQLAGDGKRFDMLTADEGLSLQPLNVKTATPEEIHRTVSGTGRGTATIYIRLKAPKELGDGEDSLVVLCDGTRPQTRFSAQRVEASSASQQAMEAVPAGGGQGTPAAPAACSAPEGEEDEANISRGELPGSDPELQPEVPEMKTENGGVLSCKVCRARHLSEAASAKHAWSHADDPGRVCGVCGEVSADSLQDHLRTRHRTDDCRLCGESFLSGGALDAHMATHSGEPSCRRTPSNHKAFLCGVCGKSLSDYRSLTRHQTTHSGERPHGCQTCGRRFKLPGTLRQHEKIHTARERTFLCDVCCKMFLTSRQLQIHMRTHSADKPFRCGECGKGFATRGPLTIHTRVHTGEAPYRCSDCGWSFKRKANLDNHLRVHSGSKPFVCGICGKACARQTYLRVHMRTHNGERPYRCVLCDKAFTQSHCLKTHMRSHLVAGAAM